MTYESRLYPEAPEGQDPYDYIIGFGLGAVGCLYNIFGRLAHNVLVTEQQFTDAESAYAKAYNHFGDQHNGLRGTYDLLQEIHAAMLEHDAQGTRMSPEEFTARLTVTAALQQEPLEAAPPDAFLPEAAAE
jgi:hypothetical protein